MQREAPGVCQHELVAAVIAVGGILASVVCRPGLAGAGCPARVRIITIRFSRCGILASNVLSDE